MLFFRPLVFLIIFIFGVYSQAKPAGYFTFGYGQGGKQLSDLTGGQDYKIAAGSGLFGSGGLVFPISPTKPHHFEGQIGIGLLFEQDIKNKQNRVSWSRLPIDALYFYRNTREHFRLGWGLTYSVNGKLSVRGANSSAKTNVDNSLGWVLSAEKLFMSDPSAGTWSLGIRYVNIKYNLSNFDKKADGSTFYLTMSIFSF